MPSVRLLTGAARVPALQLTRETENRLGQKSCLQRSLVKPFTPSSPCHPEVRSIWQKEKCFNHVIDISPSPFPHSPVVDKAANAKPATSDKGNKSQGVEEGTIIK
jgi:hypothetical protein